MVIELKDVEVGADPEYLRDAYMEWCDQEGVPVHNVFGTNLLECETGKWDRYGIDGAIVNVEGRGDMNSVFLFDIPPGGKTTPMQHLFEEVIFVLTGHGSTQVETPDGRKHSFEWGPRSLFAIPLNSKYRHFNGSGQEPVRMSSTNDMCLVMKLYRNADFIYGTPYDFTGRTYRDDYFSGEGMFIPAPRGRAMWESNFIPDVKAAELLNNDKRGKGSSTLAFILADGSMHAHSSEMPVGTYKKAHRHGPDYHIQIVDGVGYSLFWRAGDADFFKFDWKFGSIVGVPDQVFHQHFNTGPKPARYLATGIGNSRFPFTEKQRQSKLNVDSSMKQGGFQVEFEDQDPRIHKMYVEACAANGAECQMREPVYNAA